MAHSYTHLLTYSPTLGTPLLSHIKGKGRSGIYVGGALQALFGIKGNRWKKHLLQHPEKFDWFVDLLEDEYPKNCDKMEECAYGREPKSPPLLLSGGTVLVLSILVLIFGIFVAARLARRIPSAETQEQTKGVVDI